MKNELDISSIFLTLEENNRFRNEKELLEARRLAYFLRAIIRPNTSFYINSKTNPMFNRIIKITEVHGENIHTCVIYDNGYRWKMKTKDIYFFLFGLKEGSIKPIKINGNPYDPLSHPIKTMKHITFKEAIFGNGRLPYSCNISVCKKGWKKTIICQNDEIFANIIVNKRTNRHTREIVGSIWDCLCFNEIKKEDFLFYESLENIASAIDNGNCFEMSVAFSELEKIHNTKNNGK